MADDDDPEELGPDLSGTVLDGRYRVLSALGRGGMGSVYLAEDQRFAGRKVVVKVPHPELLSIPGFRKRFARELESLVQLEHLHIVKVLDSGTLDGSPYAVLQYLAGGSLEHRLSSSSGRMPFAEILKWLFPVAETLDFIHREGWMHRDIKPANILFDRHGHVFLADFGIAKALEGAGPQLTQTGRIPGSPLYMAPEVLSGQPVGPAYDQYSLGVVIYYILSGEMPHMGATPFHLMTQKITAAPSPLHPLAPQVPPRASAAVMRAISTDTQERFASCLEFAQEFERGLKEASAASEAELARASQAVTSQAPKAVTIQVPKAEASQAPKAEAIYASNAATITLPVQAAPPSRRRLWVPVAALMLFGAGLGAAYLAGLFPGGTSSQGPGPPLLQAPTPPAPPQPTQAPAAPSPPQPEQAPDGESELEALRKSCGAGDTADCFELANLYSDDREAAHDYGKAVELYRKVCDGGLSAGCSSLGVLYENGFAVAKDLGKAVELYRKACDQGDVPGCFNLGGMYSDGLGVEPDLFRAAELYRKACDGGWADACGSLGSQYEDGLGVQKDPARAAELYRKACKDGSSWSCDQLRRLGLPP